MPQFQYQPFNGAPYVDSVGNLLAHQSDAAMQAAAITANAQARAAETRGNVWGQAFQAIGQLPQQIAQARRQQQEADSLAQLRAAETQRMALENQHAQASQKVGALLAQHVSTTEDGHLVYDVAGFAKAAQADPSVAPYAHEPLDAMQRANDTYQAWKEQRFANKNALTKGLYAQVAEAGGSPDDFMLITGPFVKSGQLSEADLAPMYQRLTQVPDHTARVKLLNGAAGVKPEFKEVPQGGTLVETTPGLPPQTTFTSPAKRTETEQALDAYARSIGKTKAEDLTDAERQAYLERGAKTEAKSVLLDGKPAEVSYNPLSHKYLDASGADVTARVKPIPPASVQIYNQGGDALKNLPAWALDDSRPPSGAEGNALDRSVGMTPNGLYQAAVTWIQTGQYPQTGRGNDPAARVKRTAIESKAGAIAAAAGMDVPQLRAFYKSNAASLTQEQELFDAAQANITTADRNVAELEKYLDKLPDTGSPLFNKPLRAFAKDVKGDPNMGPIATYLASVQNEYGKIINSSNGGAVLTDSARHEAQQLIADNATVAQMIGSIRALKTEGGNRLLSVGEQIQRIQQRMQVGGPNQTRVNSNRPIKVGGFTVTVKP